MIVQRGSTPVIKYVFKAINPTNIAACYLTGRQGGETVFERDLADATVGEDYLSWRLSQAETLAIKPRPNIEVQIRYRMLDGSTGGSPISSVSPYNILKEGVI